MVYSFWGENPVRKTGLCYNRAMKTNDIVYGVHAVTEALLANTETNSYLQDDLRGKNVEKSRNWQLKESIHHGLQKISFRND